MKEIYRNPLTMIDNHSLEVVEFSLLKDKGKQQEINSLALEANEKRYQAYCLEQEALKVMDEEVIYCK